MRGHNEAFSKAPWSFHAGGCNFWLFMVLHTDSLRSGLCVCVIGWVSWDSRLVFARAFSWAIWGMSTMQAGDILARLCSATKL